MKFTSRGYRLGPFTVPVDEEVESQLLKFIQQPPGKEGLSCSLIHYTFFHYFCVYVTKFAKMGCNLFHTSISQFLRFKIKKKNQLQTIPL